jgi:hypothetical protein
VMVNVPAGTSVRGPQTGWVAPAMTVTLWVPVMAVPVKVNVPGYALLPGAR